VVGFIVGEVVSGGWLGFVIVGVASMAGGSVSYHVADEAIKADDRGEQPGDIDMTELIQYPQFY
jgi:hypothetical protein